ncbi:MAG: hypothetical protein SH859_08570 [Hyphomicrobium aestuarii]|jgi:hypothetical protein|nr:hypothetical protein [Hyphomicrobium aestuarii]
MAAGVEAAAVPALALFAGPGVGAVDAILALMVLEGLALIAYQQWTGRGIAPLAVVVNLTSGAALLLALRAVVSGWGTAVVVACLLLSFAAHIADLALRWR